MPSTSVATELTYSIALSLVKYIGPRSAIELLEAVGSAAALFTDAELRTRVLPRLPQRIALQLASSSLVEEALRIELQCAQEGIRPLFLLSEEYPASLREIAVPPMVLYVRGEYDHWMHREHISIVGTRRTSGYGQTLTRQIVKELASIHPPLTIVSGLAYGVDIRAHEAALDEGLPTVAVLAHGLDTLYPSAHRRIAEEVLRDGGAWVSEYPPGVKPYRQAFVARNRIIAGMSTATIVVEAGERSGSLSTANYALESGREVFACPGRLTDPLSVGCHQLIEGQRAHLYLGASSLGKELGWDTSLDGSASSSSNATPSEKQPTTSPAREYPPHPLLSLLAEQGMLSVDELARLSGEDLMTVRSELFDLELDGWVQTRAGGCYALL
ncbi:DNA-processing protein DprA [Porphyromonas sp.]